MKVNQDLASMSIEEIEAAALKTLEEGGKLGDGTTFSPESEGEGDPMLDAAEAKQDVEAKVSSDQAQAEPQPEEMQELPEPQPKKSDKELNFAALRAKQKQTEDDLRAAREEIKKLSSRGVFEAQLPDDHKQRMEAIESEINDIGSKFQNGDIVWEEHQRLLREASAKREALLEQSLLVKVSQEMKKQAEVQQAEDVTASWEQTVESFIQAKPDGLDYANDEAKNRDLNVYVKALAADPDNADKDFNWFISNAHMLVKSKHNITGKPAKQEPTDGEHQSDDIIPFHSLGDIPGGNLPARNEVEQLSEVSGAALANKFMNDPAAMDRYLSSLG